MRPTLPALRRAVEKWEDGHLSTRALLKRTAAALDAWTPSSVGGEYAWSLYTYLVAPQGVKHLRA